MTLSPAEVFDAVRAGLAAEVKRLSDAEKVVAEAKDRVKKGRKMLHLLAETFGISLPVEVAPVPRSATRGAGVLVVGEDGEEVGSFMCEVKDRGGLVCGRSFPSRQGRRTHTWRAHPSAERDIT